nr:hypothetical protein GCM10010200_039110 [Actinomadura rugatobispora]
MISDALACDRAAWAGVTAVASRETISAEAVRIRMGQNSPIQDHHGIWLRPYLPGAPYDRRCRREENLRGKDSRPRRVAGGGWGLALAGDVDSAVPFLV